MADIMTKQQDNDNIFRQVVNYSIKNNRVQYSCISKHYNIWRATITRREITQQSDDQSFGYTTIVTQFEVDFIPGKVLYHAPVWSFGNKCNVSFKVYRRAVQRLEEHQILQKMSL